jgi:hypothetical protein
MIWSGRLTNRGHRVPAYPFVVMGTIGGKWLPRYIAVHSQMSPVISWLKLVAERFTLAKLLLSQFLVTFQKIGPTAIA